MPGLGYNLFGEIDFNSSNIKESGVDIAWQGYSLTAMTGGASDSLVIPAQKAILPTAKEIVHFPMTAGTNWSSISRRSTDFTLTALIYSHAACQHVYYIHRTDSVVGWGKMRVYATSGPSTQYDVLMDKIHQYAVDSFYISGAAASSLALSAFGVSQGQFTDTTYRYNFYRKGSFNYLLTFNYGTDASYTTASGKFAHTDNITPAGVEELGGSTYSTVLFPNPANGSEVNLIVNGRDVTGGNYTITDMAGKTVQAGAIEMKAGAVHISLGNVLANGNYVLNVTDADNAKIATEQFTVAK